MTTATINFFTNKEKYQTLLLDTDGNPLSVAKKLCCAIEDSFTHTFKNEAFEKAPLINSFIANNVNSCRIGLPASADYTYDICPHDNSIQIRRGDSSIYYDTLSGFLTDSSNVNWVNVQDLDIGLCNKDILNGLENVLTTSLWTETTRKNFLNDPYYHRLNYAHDTVKLHLSVM